MKIKFFDKVKTVYRKIASVKYKKYVITLAIGVLLVGFLGDNSVLGHKRYQQRIAALQKEKAQYLSEYERSESQIYLFQTDTTEMRRVAREKHFMKMSDEDIFVLSDDTVTIKTVPGHETVE